MRLKNATQHNEQTKTLVMPTMQSGGLGPFTTSQEQRQTILPILF